MPTEPLSDLLNRDISASGAQKLVDMASPVLREVVNYGTRVFDRCQHHSSGDEDEDLPAFTLYLHVLRVSRRD